MTLLSQLVAYNDRGSGRAFHRDRIFEWELPLHRDGRPREPSLQNIAVPDAEGRLRGVVHNVPTTSRSSRVSPILAADDVQYVLGWPDETTKPARVAKCHEAFVDLTRRWASSDAGRQDPFAQAVWAFYRDGHLHSVQQTGEWTAKSGVLISVDGRPAYAAASVPGFWADEVAARKGASERRGLCLVCGQVRALLDRLPGFVPSRLLPGATNNAALVSVNQPVFGYDLADQLGASPICVRCGEAVTAGLVAALSSDSSASFGGQDARMAWWTTVDTGFDLMGLALKPRASEVTELLQSVHRGQYVQSRLQDGEHRAKFCSVSVGGNVARVVVRDWVEMPLKQLAVNVAAWFDHQEVEPMYPDDRRYFGIWQLALVTGRWLRDRKQYAEFGAKNANRPNDVYRDLTRAALRNTPLPPSVLVHLINRIRTDGHLDDARVALIRLALLRRPSTSENPVARLEPDNTDPAYVSGRMFAILEQIQYDASSTGGGRLNTTYGDRYFAGAISNPRAALINGQRDAAAWLRKMRRDRQGAAVRSEQALQQVVDLLGPFTGIPQRANLHQQSLFVIGYHHQRAHHFRQIAAAKAERAAASTTLTPDVATEETER